MWFIYSFILLLGVSLPVRTEQYAHFADPHAGRISWVIEESSLPWTGAYYFLPSSGRSTALLTVVDSSNGNHLGECTTSYQDDKWQRFFWTLSEDALLCNVSGSVMSKVRFPPTSDPRTFSVRVLAGRAPRCFRDLIVQNERPTDCPPLLRRNLFQQTNFECGCDAVTTTAAAQVTTSAPTSGNVAFPMFELTHAPLFPLTSLNGSDNEQLPFSPEQNLSSGVSSPSPTEYNSSTDGFNLATTPSAPIDQFGSVTSSGAEVTTARTLGAQPCAEVECLNNGTCVVGQDGQASCLCLEGFNGARCEFNLCATMPCMNGGVCRVIGTEATCECPNGVTGVLCEQALCEPECHNGGSCELVNGTTACQCMHGTTGVNCNLIDVCAQSSTCDVFGPVARCQIDEQSLKLISPVAVNASYTCECPDQNNQWVNCLDVAARGISLSPGINMRPTMSPIGRILPFGAVNETESEIHGFGNTSNTNVSESLLPNIWGELPFPHTEASTPSFPDITFTLEPSTEGFTESQNTGEFGETTEPSRGGPEDGTPEGTFGATDAGTTDNRMFTSNSFLHPIISTNNTGTGVSAFPPFSSLTIPSETESTTPSEDINQSTTMTPSDMMTTLMKSATFSNFAGSTVSPMEVMITGGMMEPSSTQTPQGTLDESNVSTDMPSMTTQPETTPIEITESTEPMQTSQSTTMMPEIPTEEEMVTEMPKESTETMPSTPSPEIPVETTEVGIAGGEEVVTSENDRYPAVEPTLGTSTQVPGDHEKDHQAAGDSPKQSSSTWIIALVIVIALLLLLAAAALLVVRYLRRSRKLHGKYNPAREENVMSNSYSMPMTTVTKEERLI